MARPKTPQTSAEVEREIRRLLEEKARLVATEDQRRGELIREYLTRPEADALREVLVPLAGDRDAYLFGLERIRTARNTGLKDDARRQRSAGTAAPV